MKKFKTLFYVKSSLVSLYLALTIPIPFIVLQELKILSTVTFILGLFFIIDVTNDFVETCDDTVSYQTSLISKFFGKKCWKIFWKDIKSIKAVATSQGSNVYYFITDKENNYLVPQRLENFEAFTLIISEKTGLNSSKLSNIAPLWTYKLLTFISLVMIIGEVVALMI